MRKVKTFIKHWIILPARRLWCNIYFTIKVNYTISICRRNGLTLKEMIWQLDEVLDILGVEDWKGDFIWYLQPLFGEPYYQFET